MKKGTIDNSMSSLRNTYLLVAILLLSNLALAQQQQNMDRDHNEQVTIIGSFDPTINQAYKINVKPEQKPLSFSAPEFEFQTIGNQVATDIYASQLTPISMKGSKRVKTYGNYLKAGFGSQLTPLVDFYHSSGKKGDNSFNASLTHFSSFSNIDNYSESPYSDTKVGLGFAKFFKYHTFDIGLNYGLNTNRYYGYMPGDFPDLSIPEDELKQSFNLIGANIGFKSKYRDADKFHHTIKLSAYYYFDKHQANETKASLVFDFHRGFNVAEVFDYQNIGLDGELTYFGNKDSITSSTDFLITVAPYFEARYGIFAFLVKPKFSFLNAEESSFNFYPVLDVAVTAIPEALVIFAGLDGNIQKNSYLNLTTINPFFTPYGIPDTSMGWQNNKLIAYAGVRGNIAKKLGFNLEIRWQKFENMTFFVNKSEYFSQPDSAIPVFVGTNNKFTVLHDNGSVFSFKGEISYAASKQLKVWLGGQYNGYTLDSLTQAFHKPITELNLGASYLFAKKLNIWTEIIYSGKRYALLSSGLKTDVEVDGFIDISLGADYAISETFSVFLHANNLLNNNYDRFYSYPVQGINILAGIGLKF